MISRKTKRETLRRTQKQFLNSHLLFSSIELNKHFDSHDLQRQSYSVAVMSFFLILS